MTNYLLTLSLIAILFTSCHSKKQNITYVNEAHNQATQNFNTYRDSSEFFWELVESLDTSTLTANALSKYYYIQGNALFKELKFTQASQAYTTAATKVKNNKYFQANLYLQAATTAFYAKDEKLYKSRYYEAAEIINRSNNIRLKAKLAGVMAQQDLKNKNYHEAERKYSSADSLLKNSGISTKRAYYQYSLGRCYMKLKQYDSSLESFEEAIHFAETNHELYILPNIYSNITRLYRRTDRFDKALEWQLKQLQLAITNKDEHEIWKAIGEKGIIYAEMENWDSSEFYFKKSVGIAHATGVKSLEASSRTNLANLYKRSGEFNKAIDEFEKVIQYRKQNNVPAFLDANIELGKLYLKQGDITQAESIFNDVLTHTDSVPNIKISSKTHEALANLYKTSHNPEKLYYHLNVYMKEKAIYDKEKNEENLNELLVRYETSENEKVILEQRNKIQTTKSKVTTLVVTLLLALTITLLSILKYKEKANMLSLLMKEQEQVKLQEQKIDSLQHTIEKLNAEQSDNHLLTEFKHLFDTKQIFKQTDISLDKLAKQMNSNTTYVSKLINSHYHCNLKTLINQYRINFCIESMGKEQDTPLKALANQAGFQSLSSFYATFKKHTGSTPAEYRSKLKF